MAKQALILYYSQFGDTARLASKIHEATGADIVRIKIPDDTFPLDMEEIISNSLRHMPSLN